MQCEQCNKDIQSVDNAHSIIIVLQKCSPSGYSFYQCNRGSTVDNHNWQHWYCCREEMNKSLEECITQHYTEDSLQPVSTEQVTLHTQVLSTGLQCLVCTADLKDTAYRFCLTAATPTNYVLNDSLDSSKEWCCSLEHARQKAIESIRYNINVG